MEYKISKEAMRLIDNVAEEAFTDGVARALDPSDDYEKTRDELETYVAKLESNLPKWETGHPEHENKVLVRVQGTSRCWYDTDYWSLEENWWWGYPLEEDGKVVGWCEIPEFDLPRRHEDVTR